MKEVEVEAELLEVMTDPLITQLLSGGLNTMLSGLASRESYGSVGAKYMQTRSANILFRGALNQATTPQTCIAPQRRGVQWRLVG